MLVVIIFTSEKHFALVDIGYNSPEGNTTVGRNMEALSVIIAIHGTSVHSISLAETVLMNKYECIICFSHAVQKEGRYSEVQQFCPEDWTQQEHLVHACIVLL
jgi:hypothetical protein